MDEFENIKEDTVLLLPKCELKSEMECEVFIAPRSVILRFFEKNGEFKRIIRSLNYKWSGFGWTNPEDLLCISLHNRAVLTACELLDGGFKVVVPVSISKDVIESNYVTEHDRVMYYKDEYFYVQWCRSGNNFYKDIKLIDGTIYSNPYVKIPKEQYLAAYDFTLINDFKVERETKLFLLNLIEKYDSSNKFSGLKFDSLNNLKEDTDLSEFIDD